MPGEPIIPAGSAPPLAPYSPGMKSGNTVFVSGTIPNDAQGNVVGKGDMVAQTERVLESIKAILEAAGSSMEDVVMNHVFITDYANYASMNEVYGRYFGNTRPARYCIKSELVHPDWLVEIASVAVLPSGE
jgi:aminoacrylate peracid reductase